MMLLAVMSWIVLAAALAWLAYGSACISSGVYVKALCRGNAGEKRVYLTFDDGPSPENTGKVLDVLEKFGAKGTFFCIGNRLEGNRKTVERIIAGGHAIGNHSWSHSPWFPLFRSGKMQDDLLRCSSSLKRISGLDTVLFRPPFGVTNPTVAEAAENLGFIVAGWDIRTYDTTGKSAEEIVSSVARRLRPGSVILMHDRLPGCADALEKLLLYLQSEGYAADRTMNDIL